MGKLERSRLDSPEGIEDGRRVYASMFLSIKDEPHALELVSNYREGVEKTLKRLDEEMCAIMDDLGDRTTWAVRMRECNARLRALTMNLAFWGKPEWSWEEVAEAMGFLRSITEGTDSTLGRNERRPKTEPA